MRRSEAADKNDASAEIAAIKQWEHDALAADLKGDFAFYERGLSDDWTDGMSTGEFQTKQILVSDLKDPINNITREEHLSEIKVRLYGQTAIATYEETYDALIHGERRAKTIITTDTFVKRDGRWLQVAAHSSALMKK